LKTKRHVSRQGNTNSEELGISNSFRKTLGSNSHEETQSSQGQSTSNPQDADHGPTVKGMMDNSMLSSQSSPNMENSEGDYSSWSKDLRDWCNFPGTDFGLDDFFSM
jgi:hypothetical protein